MVEVDGLGVLRCTYLDAGVYRTWGCIAVAR